MALQQPSVNEDIQLVDNEKGIATHHETADILELKAEAQRAEDFEHKISFIESVKIYKKVSCSKDPQRPILRPTWASPSLQADTIPRPSFGL